LKRLRISTGATVTLSSHGSHVINTDSLVVAGSPGAWTSKLQLVNNDLIVHSTNANVSADFANVVSQVKSGFNLASVNQLWTGNGIVSSAAAGDASKLLAVGVISNNATT